MQDLAAGEHLPKVGCVGGGLLGDSAGALDVALTEEDLLALDRAFPPPRGKSSLGVL